jgi:hypothetical protein
MQQVSIKDRRVLTIKINLQYRGRQFRHLPHTFFEIAWTRALQVAVVVNTSVGLCYRTVGNRSCPPAPSASARSRTAARRLGAWRVHRPHVLKANVASRLILLVSALGLEPRTT